jgi:sugar lactone lactonase YvrE
MKKYFVLLTVAVVICGSKLSAQQVNISNNNPSQDPTAILEIKSTDKGILLPRITAAQRNAISQPAKGLLVFQTDGTAGFYYYDGNSWLSLTGSAVVNSNGVSEKYGLVTVYAGSTSGNVNGYDTAKFRGPDGITIDRLGNLYVADSGNHNIRKIAPDRTATLFAGSSAGYIDDTAAQAAFNMPISVAADLNGNIYVAELSNSRIRKIDPAAAVTTFAGNGFAGFIDGTGTAASFNKPMGIATDNAGNIYVADTYNHRIRKISPAGGVTTIAGNGSPGFFNSLGINASFSRPAGLTLDEAGNIYVADMDNHSIRKINPSGTVTTFAGTGSPGSSDGTVSTASFNSPKAITIDKEGNFYIADAGNHTIRKITPDGIVSTLAGAGSPGFSDGISGAVHFNNPSGVVADKKGNLYVTDTGNHIIRKIVIR